MCRDKCYNTKSATITISRRTCNSAANWAKTTLPKGQPSNQLRVDS